MTRFWQASPVATLIGAIALAIVAWPSTSSGLVGSSIHQGWNSRQRLHVLDGLGHVPALVRVHHQRALRAERLADDARRGGRSSSWSLPTFILMCVQPAATASWDSRRTFSSE